MSSRPVPDDLLPWALELLPSMRAENAHLAMIAGDASNRRYFRLTLGKARYIIAEAPPATEKNAEFVMVQRLLAAAQVRVPELISADVDRGYLLLEDLGDRMLLPELTAESVNEHYGAAFGLLLKMASVDLSTLDMPAYDTALLSEELSRFDEWFVDSLLGYTLSAPERELLGQFGSLLVDSALQQPRVIVHRDFHSRNLMLLDDDQLVAIDFQDAVVGPVTYDLASLLKDCYIRWPDHQVKQWALAYRQLLLSEGLMDEIDEETFLRWFDWMGLQRHVKVLGTFARLSLRDNKAAYLNDLPLVVQYIEQVVAKYADEEPVLRQFGSWFSEKLAPLIAGQHWSAQS